MVDPVVKLLGALVLRDIEPMRMVNIHTPLLAVAMPKRDL